MRKLPKAARDKIEKAKTTRDVFVQVMAQYKQDGVPVGAPVVMAKAKLVYMGPVDDPIGPVYVLGVTEPLKLDPSIKFGEGDLSEARHVIELSGNEVKRGGKARDGRSLAAIRRRDEYRSRPGIRERDRLILQCRDQGMTLKETAEAIKHLDPTGLGWTPSLIGQVERRLRSSSKE